MNMSYSLLDGWRKAAIAYDNPAFIEEDDYGNDIEDDYLEEAEDGIEKD